MSYFFPIPVPFVPGIPIPPFHLNAYSPRPTTASAAKKAAPKRKTQIDTVEITGRTGTNKETPKKLRPMQLLKWITRSDKKKTAESAEPTTHSFEVVNRPAHKKDKPSEASTATASSPVMLSSPPAEPQFEPLISKRDAQIIAAAFRNGLRAPNSAAILRKIGGDED